MKHHQSLTIENNEKSMKKLQTQIESMTATIKEYDGLKRLELAELKKEYNNNECILQKKIQDLSTKTKNQEKQYNIFLSFTDTVDLSGRRRDQGLGKT